MQKSAVTDGETTKQTHSVLSQQVARGVYLTLSTCGVWICIKAFHYGIGTFTKPGVGAWPLITGSAITAFSLWLLWRETKQPSREAFNYTRPALLWLFVAVLAILLNFITFLVICSLSLFAIFKIIGNASWLQALIGALSITVTTYAIFSLLLSVPLP